MSKRDNREPGGGRSEAERPGDHCKSLGFFALSQYVAHDLPTEEQQRVATHLSGCESCRALLQQIEQDQADYAELGQEHYNVAWRHAVTQTTEASDAQQARRRPLFPLLWKVLLPVAAAALVAALLVPRLMTPPPRQPQYKGYKGGLSLQIIAKRKDRQFVVADNQRLCPGDALRFSVTAAGHKSHLVVVSLDRANTLSTFYPNETTPPDLLARSGQTVKLTGPGRHVLPGSIILDRSQGREVIVILAAPKPFDPRPLQQRIQKLFKQDPCAAEVLDAKKIGFSGTVRAMVIVKAPCS
jgi:Putative zinc-finger